MKKKNTYIFLRIFLLLFLLNNFSFGLERERILSFDSNIKINKDASMIVTETIKVYAAGDKIKRGIYRDFPTKYKDDLGNKIVVDMDVLEVYRNGNSEDYHIENISNGKRIYLGNENVYLTSGEYTYKIIYKTSRQLGFFTDHDELYWNVTGNGWDFLVDKVTAEVTLPEYVPTSKLKCYGYTGVQGSRSAHLTCKTSMGKASYETTYPLGSGEGLTIVFEFPKGIVSEPTSEMKIGYFFSDNKNEAVGILALISIFFYYFFVWVKVGKDPENGLIIPQYAPPENLSPSSVRFISKMGYDNKIFTAAIINMAVKGYLKIKEDDGEYILIKKSGDKSVLSKDEKKIADKLLFSSAERNSVSISSALKLLFNKGKNIEANEPVDESEKQLKLTNKNHVIFQSAIKALKDDLKNSYEKTYFLTNKTQFGIGVLITIIFLGINFIFGVPEQGFMVLWLSGWSVGVSFLVLNVFRTWRQVLNAGKGKVTLIGSALFITLFSIPFVIGEVVGFYFFYSFGSLLSTFIFAIIVFLNILFYHLLKAPTLLGRKILDKIDGFKMYLSAAEKNRLNYITPEQETPELFEKYLPYALALDVEQKWAEKFSAILEKAGVDSSYSPAWYSGSNWNSFHTSGFISSFSNSFSSAISSSSSAPGSSSGSGGSSGGGGGGGGGGGW